MLGSGEGQLYKDGKIKAEKFYLVTELASNGELFDFVIDADGLPNPLCRQLFGQILEGMDFMHDKGMVHRDLKLENCFVNEKVIVKIADFGTYK